MRIASATLPLSALLAAACSNAPSQEEITAANTNFTTCATTVLGQTVTGKVTATLTNLDAETKPAHADFNVGGALPETHEKVKINDKELDATVSASITFKNASGEQIVSLSGYKNSIGMEGGRNQSFSETLKLDGGEQRGVNVTVVYQQLQQCADNARAPLLAA